MSTLPRPARTYVGVVMVTGGAAAVAAALSATFSDPAGLAALLTLGLVSAVFKIELPLPLVRDDAAASTMSLAFIANVAVLLVYGVPEAMLVAIAGAWAQSTFRVKARNPLHRTLFNMAALSLTMGATGLVFVGLGGRAGLIDIRAVWPLLCAAGTYFLVNSGLIAAAIGWSTGQRPHQIWRAHFADGWVHHLFGAGFAAVAAVGMQQTSYSIGPLLVIALYFAHRSYRAYVGRIEIERRAVRTISELHRRTVEALALAIDAKSEGSERHLTRMQRHGRRLAAALKLSVSEVQAIETAALLHDIGLLGVPTHVLSKRDPRTPEEERTFQHHARIGAAIVRSVPFPGPVAPMIVAHHERWDGTGYPSGLAGDAIPLGGRILALVDRFDMLLEEHSNWTIEDAMLALEAEAGHSLDPSLVQRFVELTPDIIADERAWAADGRPGVGVEALSLDGSHDELGDRAIEHILLATREGSKMLAFVQTLGADLDVGQALARLAPQLSELVPFSTCALLVHGGEAEELFCRAAWGIHATDIDARVVSLEAAPAVADDMRQGRSTISDDPLEGFLGLTTSSPVRVRTSLFCPLIGDGVRFGVLALLHDRAGSYQADHRRIVEQLARPLGAAFWNALQFEQTRVAAFTDRLTRLANSRGLAAGFDRLRRQATQEGQPLAVIMADLDNLKLVNDAFGHDAGDAALRVVARGLSQALRPNDLSARYAGDEFVLVLAGCRGPDAVRRARDLQQAIERLPFSPRAELALSLRISVGAAVYPDDGQTLEDLLTVADRRMYADKGARPAGGRRFTPDPAVEPLRLTMPATSPSESEAAE
jgi:diguanylate cyclase (GGDEF)-like protein/putative nucleotidyltransferase with HDIG domain